MVEVRGTYNGGGNFIHDGFIGAEAAFEEALDSGLDFVGCDAGSTDCGPWHLGSDQGLIPDRSLRMLLEYLLPACVSRKIPLLIGSANLSGSRAGVARFKKMISQVAADQGLKFRAAYLDSEIDVQDLKKQVAAGRTRPLDMRDPLTAEELDRTDKVVAMMGTEPYVRALEEGADVIVGGRTTDPALFAAVPIWKGVPPGVAWHFAKAMDHGGTNLALDASAMLPGSGVPTWVIGIAADDHFRIVSSNDKAGISAHKVAQSTLHENASPVSFLEPPGRVDIDNCTFEQVDPHTVRVTGSRLTPLPYTVKLEGVRRVGRRAMTMCAYRHPDTVRNIRTLMDNMRGYIAKRAQAQGIMPDEYQLIIRNFGTDGILGPAEPNPGFIPQEAVVVCECITAEQEVLDVVMTMVELKLHVLGGPHGGGAFPHSPHVIPMGDHYEFNVWHVLELDDPLACCTIDIVDY